MMFDPKIPNNHLPLLPWEFIYQDIALYTKALQAQQELSRLNGLIHLLPNANVLLTPLITAESVSSSAIENINTTTVEVLKSYALPPQSQVWPEKEVLYYRQAIMYGYELMKNRDLLITWDIIQIQQIIEPNKHGIRTLAGTVIADGQWHVIYTPPHGKTVILDLLTNLEIFINTHDDDIYPLIKTGVIHFQFEAIHPFYDGNGRTGRILMILYLTMTKLLDYPVLFLSGYIYQHKQQYYEILQYTQKTSDYTKIINYILDAILVQSKVTSQKIIGIQQLITQLEQQITEIIPKKSSIITRSLLKNPFSTLQYFADDIGVTRHTARSYINKLIAAQIIQKTQAGKYTLISVPAFIHLLSE